MAQYANTSYVCNRVWNDTCLIVSRSSSMRSRWPALAQALISAEKVKLSGCQGIAANGTNCANACGGMHECMRTESPRLVISSKAPSASASRICNAVHAAASSRAQSRIPVSLMCPRKPNSVGLALVDSPSARAQDAINALNVYLGRNSCTD